MKIVKHKEEEVVVRLLQDWYEYRKGEVIVVSRGQAELIKCEILGKWKGKEVVE